MSYSIADYYFLQRENYPTEEDWRQQVEVEMFRYYRLLAIHYKATPDRSLLLAVILGNEPFRFVEMAKWLLKQLESGFVPDQRRELTC